MNSTAIILKSQKSKKSRRPKGRMGDPNQAAVSAYAGDAYSLAKRTWTGLNEIRKLINIEEKYFDTDTSMTATNTGNLLCLSQVAQGVGLSDRIGNSIKVQRLSITGRVAILSSNTTYSVCRVAIVRDMEGQGTAPVATDIFETLGTSSAPRQHYDYLNRKRFAVLYDELFTLFPYSTGQGSAAVFRYDVPLNKHVLYRGATAAAASNGEGSIYIVFVSDEATTGPSCNAVARIVFTDD